MFAPRIATDLKTRKSGDGLAFGTAALDWAHCRHHQAAALTESLRAADLELNADDLRELNEAAASVHTEGDRYAPAQQQLINR